MIITIASNKGGTGKTTTVENLAAALSKLGKKVMVVDLDSQANLTTAFGISPDQIDTKHVGDLLLEDGNYQDYLFHSNGIDIIPSTARLGEYEERLSTRTSRETKLKKALKPARDSYDYILLDTPPALGLLTNNAFFTSESYIIPVNPEYFAYAGIINMINHVSSIEDECDIEFGGILLTRYNPAQRGKVIQAFAKRLQGSDYFVFQTTIRQNIRIVESQLQKESVIDYDPESPAAVDYMSFANELITKYEKETA